MGLFNRTRRRARRAARRERRRARRAARREHPSGKRGLGLLIYKASNRGLNPAWIAMAPFKKEMKRILAERGVNVSSNSTAKIGREFHRVVIKGQSFDDYYLNHSLDPITISAIIGAITSFFKMIKEKVSRGEPASESEKKIARNVALIEQKADEMTEEEVDRIIGEEVRESWYSGKLVGFVIAGIVGVVILTYLATRQ